MLLECECGGETFIAENTVSYEVDSTGQRVNEDITDVEERFYCTECGDEVFPWMVR